MQKFREWLIKNFLPAWARECMEAENARLRRELEAVKIENRRLRDYMDGLETALRYAKKITINLGDLKK